MENLPDPVTRIFLSWSGEDSRSLAGVLRTYLPLVFHEAVPWMSAEDIPAGGMWSHGLFQSLSSAKLGIICVTTDNFESPWLLFEAGALSRAIGTEAVVPYLAGFKITDLKGPLAQFQAVESNQKGTASLLKAINLFLHKPLDKQVLQKIFDVWWPHLENDLRRALEARASHKKRSDSELLQEMVEHLRFLRRSEHGRPLSLAPLPPEIPGDIKNWGIEKIFNYFEYVLMPEALDRARRDYEHISVQEDSRVIWEHAKRLAEDRAIQWELKEEWHRWSSR